MLAGSGIGSLAGWLAPVGDWQNTSTPGNKPSEYFQATKGTFKKNSKK